MKKFLFHIFRQFLLAVKATVCDGSDWVMTLLNFHFKFILDQKKKKTFDIICYSKKMFILVFI